MRRIRLLFIPIILTLTTLACSFGGPTPTPIIITATPLPPTTVPATETPVPPTDAPVATETTAPESTGPMLLDPCTLFSAADAEVFFAQPAGPATPSSGTCYYMNASDSLYTASVAAAQGADTMGIYQGQAMLLGMAGIQLDQTDMDLFKTQAAAQDAAGFFSELVKKAEGSTKLSARLLDTEKNDLEYWLWIPVDTRNQGALVVLRGKQMVNVNLVVPESQTEEMMMTAARELANRVLDQLPAEFSIFAPTQAVEATSTPMPTPTLILLPAPYILFPKNGQIFEYYPRDLTLDWEEVDGAAKYELELQFCDGNGKNCVDHPMYDDPARVTTQTSYSFTFVGGQPGRWRVRAIDGSGIQGEFSSWFTFVFTH